MKLSDCETIKPELTLDKFLPFFPDESGESRVFQFYGCVLKFEDHSDGVMINFYDQFKRHRFIGRYADEHDFSIDETQYNYLMKFLQKNRIVLE